MQLALAAILVSGFLAAPGHGFGAAPRLSLRMSATESPATAAAPPQKLEGERYVVMNRFAIRPGAEAKLEARWANRKSRLSELPGFRYFHLMRRENPVDGGSPPDEWNYMSFTVWETKKDFEVWRTGDAFKEAHGGGGIGAFVQMFKSLEVMKGPPKPAMYEAILPLANPEAKPAHAVVDGWRDVEADGEKVLDAEAYVATNRFAIEPAHAAAFEQRWASRTSALLECKGFRNFQMLRRDGPPDDGVNYISTTIWENKECFNLWREGQGFQKAHGQQGEKKPDGAAAGKPDGKPPAAGGPGGSGPSIFKKPPRPVFFEATLTIQSQKGY